MDIVSAFISQFIFIVFMWLVITADARRQPGKRRQNTDCSRRNGDENNCRKRTNEVNCGKHYLVPDSEAVISSQWITSSKNKKHCKWKFQTDEDVHLRVTCDLSLPESARCRSAHLFITDGNARKNKLCGNERSLEVMSDTRILKVISKIDRARASSTNFKCIVKASVSANVPNTPPPDDSSPKCKCGRANRVRRIVGGRQVDPHEYPWQVALVRGNSTRPYCGGSIISDSWILTAAHCLNRIDPKKLSVVIGEHDWSTSLDTKLTRRLSVKYIVWHSGFTMRVPLDDDIGLVQLEVPLIFPEDNSLAPVCLPLPYRSYPEANAVVVGWGTTEHIFSGSSQVLRVAEVKTMQNPVCQSLVSVKGLISRNMICAGYLFSGENACHGDSGGPLLTGGEGCGGTCLENIGVVSWGAFCNLGVFPTVYTRTNRYLNWINMFIRDTNTCQREE